MPNLKFSQFQEQTDTSNVQFVVGYNGTDNVRISPSNLQGDFLPLTGGALTGALSTSSTMQAATYNLSNTNQSIFSYSSNLVIYSSAGTNVSIGGGPGSRQNDLLVPNGYIYTNEGLRLGSDTTANELDDYEVGTFTPNFDIIGGTVTASYATRRAAYVKIGSMVTVWMEFKTNNLSLTSGSGSAQITGLPFQVGSITCCPTYIYPSGGNLTNVGYVNWSTNSNLSNVMDLIPTAIPGTTYLLLKYTPYGNFYNTSTAMSGTNAWRVHSSPTPAANEFALTLTYYTDQ